MYFEHYWNIICDLSIFVGFLLTSEENMLDKKMVLYIKFSLLLDQNLRNKFATT